MAIGKKCFRFFSWAVFGYLVYKVYRYITGVINISKELPVYLKNVVGEKPGMNLNVIFNKLTVILTFSENTINEHPNIADLTQEYINRYYPIFRQDHITIQVLQKEKVTPVTEKKEDIEDSEVPEKLEPES